MSCVLTRLLPLASRPAVLAGICAAFSCTAFGGTNDIDIARQALRDGFWSLARSHAQAADGARGAASREIIVESWAREGKWSEVLKALVAWDSPSGDAFAYYRALALAKTGETRAAQDVFAKGLPADPVFNRLAARLLADLALKTDDPKRTVELLERIPSSETDDKILLAEAKSRLGVAKDAEKLWREVLADTNAPVRAMAAAAANVGDAVRLRALAVDTNGVPAEVRSLARLRLGRLLLASPQTFDEGAKLVRGTVAESPDAEGALDAYQALADARLGRGEWKEATVAFGEILEIWPIAARMESVQEGLGWAYLKLGRAEDALTAFGRAEACAKTDEERAMASVKTGDALAALGRIDESTAKCREVLSRWPKTRVAGLLADIVRLRELESKGRALYREFRFAEAQKCFAEVGSGDALRRGRMGYFEVLCLYGQGRDSEAEAQARKIAKETDDPRLRADATVWLARAAYNAGRWKESRELFCAYADAACAAPADAAGARVWAARAALAANDFSTAIALAAKVVDSGQETAVRADALTVQGEALIELARFDEAVLVFERAALVPGVSQEIRLEAQVLRADALFAQGADNPIRYEEALAAYRALALSESATDTARLRLAYKVALTLEKLRRRDEAVDEYYAHVVLAYRDARLNGKTLDDETRAVFARAALRLADLCEAGGKLPQTVKTLELLAASDVPAAAEAKKRIDRIRKKGILP